MLVVNTIQFFQRICINKVENRVENRVSSQPRETLLFLTTNMAVATSRANQQYPKR